MCSTFTRDLLKPAVVFADHSCLFLDKKNKNQMHLIRTLEDFLIILHFVRKIHLEMAWLISSNSFPGNLYELYRSANNNIADGAETNKKVK